MKLPQIFATALIALNAIFTVAQAQNYENRAAVIPQPYLMQNKNGGFTLGGATVIAYTAGNGQLAAIAAQLSDKIKLHTGMQIPVKGVQNPVARNHIALVLADAAIARSPESYIVDVSPAGIIIKAGQAQGCFYGTQTLLQLVQVNNGQTAPVPACYIQDEPRFKWRGTMLDVSRHFFTVDEVKQYIDLLAMYKINTFHWHLTDNQGWRVEIKKYPKLTTVGAWRKRSMISHFETRPEQFDTIPYGGFYTQKDIKDVVAYAAQRFITIVPEIDVPGHSSSALAAYPELGCGKNPGPYAVVDRWGIFDDVYCAGKENTFKFIEAVFAEVSTLFPGQYIHIGGDECRKTNWKKCPYCQSRIRNEKLSGEEELQAYFVNRVGAILKKHNKKIIGWDEIQAAGNLVSDAAIMSWRGTSGGVAAAKNKRNVVMSPTNYLYLDYYQGAPALEPLGIDGFNTLERVYQYNPMPAQLSADELVFINGVQGNMWTEFIPTYSHLQYMAFPRMAALAETAWSYPENKNWERFKQNMETEYQRYNRIGIRYSKSAYQVKFEVVKGAHIQKTQVVLSTQSYNPDIYYTLNGENPTVNSIKYVGPFQVNAGAVVKAACFKNGAPVEKATECLIQ